MAKYIIEVPDKWVDITNGLHIPIETGWDVGDFRIDTGLKLTPYTEPDRQAIEDEVWEFAKEVRLEEFIDEEGRLHGYISGFNSYSEAKAKYEAWKKQKEEIRVGDEVKYVEDHRKKIVVTSTYSDGWFDAIDSNGYLYINRNPVMWKKTGRHFPELIELLKKMGEESYV